jgi:hypothetical protein
MKSMINKHLKLQLNKSLHPHNSHILHLTSHPGTLYNFQLLEKPDCKNNLMYLKNNPFGIIYIRLYRLQNLYKKALKKIFESNHFLHLKISLYLKSLATI